MKRKLLFYSSVPDVKLFETQKFYKIDIDILKELNFDVKVTNKIRYYLCFWKYDVAFIYFYRYGFFVSLIAKLLGKKVYFTGGIDDLEKSFATPRRYKIQKLFFKLCYCFSDNCILVSSADRDNVRKIYKGTLPKKISLSFHVIRTQDYLCNDYIKKNDNFTTIIWMGGVENIIRKGVDVSLKLFQQLISKYSEYQNSKFIIIGKKGGGTNCLVKLSEELNISDKVEFTDEVDENTKIDLLKNSRFYMQLSKYEGFGLAAAEALAARNIVINSGKGGLKDSVGCHGVQVNIDEDLAQQINLIHEQIKTMDKPKLKVGAQYVIDNFSYDNRKNDFKKIISD